MKTSVLTFLRSAVATPGGSERSGKRRRRAGDAEDAPASADRMGPRQNADGARISQDDPTRPSRAGGDLEELRTQDTHQAETARPPLAGRYVGSISAR
jgi:hypothetical protein